MVCSTFTISQIPTAQVVTLYPTGDDTSDHSPVGEVSNYLCVDESRYVPNDDTDYVYNNITSEKTDLYNVGDHTSESGIINFVTVHTRAKSYLYQQAAEGVYKILCSENGTTGESSDYAPLNMSYNNMSAIFVTNPDTSAAWEWDEIDSMKIGFKSKSTSSYLSNQLVLDPNAAGDTTDLDPDPGDWANYQCVSDDGTATNVYNNDTAYKTDLYNLQDHTTETGTITKITVFMGWAKAGPYADRYIKIGIKTGGSEFWGSETIVAGEGGSLSTSWDTNPDTLVAWTWADIDSLQAGISLSTSVSFRTIQCHTLYVVVDYFDTFTPDIRTTQCYTTVNYIPATSSLTLSLPQTVDYRHGNRIGKSVFRDKTYMSRDYGRRNKTLSLEGTQTSDVTTSMNTLRTMCKLGFPITITGMDDRLDGEYRIKDYTLRYENGVSSIALRWMLEIERTS